MSVFTCAHCRKPIQRSPLTGAWVHIGSRETRCAPHWTSVQPTCATPVKR